MRTGPGAGRGFGYVLAAVLIGYFALAGAAVEFAPPGTKVAAWWPAAGLAVAATVWFPGRRRLAVLVAVGAGSVAANIVGGRPTDVAAAFTVANLVEAILATVVLERLLGHRPVLRDPRGLVRFVLAVAAGASAAAVLAGLTVRVLVDGSFLTTLWAVTASHGAAVLLIAPLVLVRRGEPSPARPAEIAVQTGALVGVVLFVFGPGQDLPLVFLPLPLLAWGAMRLGPWWVLVQVLAAGVLASLLTTAGHGPFTAAVEAFAKAPEVVGALLQVNLICYGLVAIPIALASLQRRVALGDAVLSNELLNSVLTSATGVSIIGTDASGTVTFFSAGASSMLGYSSEELVAKTSPALVHDETEIAARAAELGIEPGFAVFTHHVDHGASAECRDWTYVTKGGERLTVSLRVTRRLSASGVLLGYLGVAEDVTARRRAEAVLQAALDQERAARERQSDLDRAKSDFVATVSHELRTPLTSVLGYTDLLLSGAGGPLTDQQSGLLGKVDANGRRLLTLIEDLLLAGRIEGQGGAAPRVPVDLEGVVRHAVAMARTGQHDRDVTCEILGDASYVVCGDRVELQRMLENLVSNAVKFTEQGGTIAIRLMERGGVLVVEVEDDGLGIPERDQDQVFDRFFRSATARSRVIPGTGLGLAIVRAVVTAHGGRVSVSSREQVGSTFRVELPALTVTKGGAAAEEPCGGGSGQCEEVSPGRASSGPAHRARSGGTA